MNRRVIKALLKKDASLFLNNRFYLLVTVVGVVFFIAAYFILPSSANEKLNLAVYAPQLPPAFSAINRSQGIKVDYYNDIGTLKESVLNGSHPVGIALPDDILKIWAEGGKPQIELFYGPGTAPETRDAVRKLMEDMVYAQTGQTLNYIASSEILGPDLAGRQIPPRDRLRPLLAVFLLLMEILTLASLISTEIEQGTARAILTTPMRVSDLFLAKGLLGVGLALAQAVLFMLIAGGFSHQPLIILAALTLGSLLVVGVAFLLASLTRDVNAVTGWGLLVFITLAIPGLGEAIPGLFSGWVRVIPSFYLTDVINGAANYDSGWQAAGPNLLILAAIAALLVWGGMAALRRRYQ